MLSINDSFDILTEKKKLLIRYVDHTQYYLNKNINDIVLAAYNNNITKIQQYIKNGLDINSKIYLDTTLLVHAINREHYELCEFLIKNGADVNIIINDENLLMRIINFSKHCFNPNFKIFKLLIDSGCDVNYTNSFGFNTLHFLCMQGSNNHVFYKIIELLIENGIDIFAKDNTGNIPSYWFSSDLSKLLNSKVYTFLKQKEQELELFNQSFKRAHIEDGLRF
jgi:hypothetical protein